MQAVSPEFVFRRNVFFIIEFIWYSLIFRLPPMQKAFKHLDYYKVIIAREWLLLGAFVTLIFSSLFFHHFPVYSEKEFQVIFVLFSFFIAVKGLEQSNLMIRLSRVIEAGEFIELKFILATFLLSMFVTNDIALLMVVPLTLLVNVNRKGVLVILEALAANAGSAMTPFGNPQNLFIYWIYSIHPITFISAIAPFSIFFLVFILLVSWIINGKGFVKNPETTHVVIHSKAYVYLILLTMLVMVILHLLPVWMATIVIIYALIFDRRSLKIDYALLLTFVCFFGLADNLKDVFSIGGSSPVNIFLYTAGISQIISNVPATLLISKYTSQWEALLWGSNVGGFGTLVASLANLIAYKLYISNEASKNKKVSFTILFLIMGFIALLIGVGLYFLLKNSKFI